MGYIQAEKVEFSYDGDEGESVKKVLRGISMEIQRGEFVALLGHNGSGKSTMAKMFNAMLLPSQGKVFIDGLDTVDEQVLYEIRRRVGLVLQNPDNQLVASVVEEDVAFGPENLGVPPAEIRERVDAALKAVEMYDFRLNAPYKLSGGQKQRVALARALVNHPNIIIADEPTAALDKATADEIMEVMKSLNSIGKTIVIVTHDRTVAEKCRRIVELSDGEIISDKTIA